MIAVVSCDHNPDDERIFHKQIQSLIEKRFQLIYFTRSDKNLDLSNSLIKHYNFRKNMDIKTYINTVGDILFTIKDLSHVQIHETDLLRLLKNIKLKQINISTIYDVHENMEALYRTFSNRTKLLKELSIFIRQLKEKKYLKYVDKIILANPPLSNNYYINEDIPTTIIENFPELKYLKTVPSVLRKNHSIIYHGHLGPERGIQDLVKAMTDVIQHFPEAALTLIGTFRTKIFRTQIYRLIDDLKLNQSIHIFDQIPHVDIWTHLSKHTIGVIPFRKTPLTKENTPTKLFEMMVAGLKIVSSDLPPTRNFVGNSIHWSEPGDVFSLASALIHACSMPNNHHNLRKNKELIKKNYNWEKNKDKYLSLFYSR